MLKGAAMARSGRRGPVYNRAESNLHLRVIEILVVQHNHLVESLLADPRLDLLEKLVLPLDDARSYGPRPRPIVG